MSKFVDLEDSYINEMLNIYFNNPTKYPEIEPKRVLSYLQRSRTIFSHTRIQINQILLLNVILTLFDANIKGDLNYRRFFIEEDDPSHNKHLHTSIIHYGGGIHCNV